MDKSLDRIQRDFLSLLSYTKKQTPKDDFQPLEPDLLLKESKGDDRDMEISNDDVNLQMALREPLAFVVLQPLEFPSIPMAETILQRQGNVLAESKYFHDRRWSELKELKQELDNGSRIWQRHLEALLNPTIMSRLSREEMHQLYEPYFLAHRGEFGPGTNLHLSLKVLSKHLKFNQDALVLDTVVRLVNKLSKASLFQIYEEWGKGSKREADWEDWIQLLLSLPDKMSNVLKTSWNPDYLGGICLQFVELVPRIDDVEPLTRLLGKLLRLNLADALVSQTDITKQDVETWKKILKNIPSMELNKFMLAYLSRYKDDFWLANVLQDNETGIFLLKQLLTSKPLAEPKSFLIVDTLARITPLLPVLEDVATWWSASISPHARLGGLDRHWRQTCILMKILSHLQRNPEGLDSYKLSNLLNTHLPPHLSHTNKAIHKRGLVFGEEITKLARKVDSQGVPSLNFDLDQEGEVVTLRNLVHPKQAETNIETTKDNVKPEEKVVLVEDDLIPYDLQETSDEEGNSLSTVRPPRYLLELQTYLSSDDPQKIKMGISHSKDILSSLTQGDLSEAGRVLLLLARLTNEYDLKDFEDKRRAAIVSLLKRCVQLGVHEPIDMVVNSMFDKNMSLNSKVVLLEALTLVVSPEEPNVAKTPGDLGKKQTLPTIAQVEEKLKTRKFKSAEIKSTMNPLYKNDMIDHFMIRLIGRVGYSGNQWDPLRPLDDLSTIILDKIIRYVTIGLWSIANGQEAPILARILWDLCWSLRFYSTSQTQRALNPSWILLRSILMAFAVILNALPEHVVGQVVSPGEVEGVVEWCWSVMDSEGIIPEDKMLCMEVLHGLKRVVDGGFTIESKC